MRRAWAFLDACSDHLRAQLSGTDREIAKAISATPVGHGKRPAMLPNLRGTQGSVAS